MRTAGNSGARSAPTTFMVADASWTGLARALDERPTLCRVEPADLAFDVVDASCRLRPHVLLLPGDSPGRMVQLLGRLRLRSPGTQVLVVSERTDPVFACALLRHGARGCIRPSAPVEHFARAIVATRNGEVWMERRVLADALATLSRQRDPPFVPAGGMDEPGEPLTRREHEIVAWVSQGLTNKEVARELGVSHETVKKHLKRVFTKLGVHHRLEVILRHHA